MIRDDYTSAVKNRFKLHDVFFLSVRLHSQCFDSADITSDPFGNYSDTRRCIKYCRSTGDKYQTLGQFQHAAY